LDQAFGTLRSIAIVFVFLQTVVIIYRIRNVITYDRTDNIIRSVTNGFTVFIYFSLFFLFLKYNGVSPVQFFTSISIVAAAVAIISKDYLTAILSGFFISFTKVVNIGEYITVGTSKGVVKDIKLTKLLLENDQGELIILSNEKVFQSDIINHSRSNKRQVILDFELSPSQSYNIDELENSLIESINKYTDHIVEDSFSLRVDQILIDKIKFTFLYTLKKLETEVASEIRRKTLRNLIKFIQSKHNTPFT
jgi:small-conductance mechanosensitive channel